MGAGDNGLVYGCGMAPSVYVYLMGRKSRKRGSIAYLRLCTRYSMTYSPATSPPPL